MGKLSVNNKIFCGLIIGASCMFSLTACGDAIPTMTEQQSQDVGEYAAMLLLKYDANHRSRLVDLTENNDEEVVEEQETDIEPEIPVEDVAEPETPEGEEPTPEIPVVDVSDGIPEDIVSYDSLESVLGLPDGVVMVYKGYSWSYNIPPSSDGSSMVEAEDGNKLLIVSYSIYNQSSTDVLVDLLSSDIRFKASINDSVTLDVLPAWVRLDDMASFYGEVKSGVSRDLVLVFETSETNADAMTYLKLLVSRNDKKVLLDL